MCFPFPTSTGRPLSSKACGMPLLYIEKDAPLIGTFGLVTSGLTVVPSVHVFVFCEFRGQVGIVAPVAKSTIDGNMSTVSVGTRLTIPSSVRPGTRYITGAWVARSKLVCLLIEISAGTSNL